MAITFDESDDYFVITDHASLTLQDGDWCVGTWTKIDDNAGSDYQYILSNGNFSANNSINIFIGETSNSNPDYADKWQVSLEDGDGTNPGQLKSTVATGADSKWWLIVVQRDTTANEVQLWGCEPGQAPTKWDSKADTNFNAVNGGDWNIGRRVDGNADRYWGSIATEFFKGDFALTSEEIAALGAGVPAWALGHTLDVYLPMRESVASLKDLIGGNNAARQSAPTTVEHAPVRLATGPIAVQAVVAAPPVGQPLMLRATTVPHFRQWQPGAFQ